MAPQWMPQNIQKRLLLYLLQQLSLFSGIDLENLEVSLGSSSQVTLNDVEIDTDAFKIPGVHLRNGRIKNLNLKLNMTGGVNFEVDGLFITMALAYTANNQSSSTLSKSTTSMLESILTEHSKETLQQSTIDLAQSLMQDEEFQTPAQSIYQSFHDAQSEGPAPSTMNSVMSKAVEMALSRLNVNVKNILIHCIMDHATVDLEIKNGSLVTENGKRIVKITDIMVLSSQPSENPGEFASENSNETTQDSQGPQTSDGSEKYEDEINDTESDSDLEDNKYNEDDENKMMTSSILERNKDLDSSLIYSKEETESIYMSAASDTFEAKRQELVDATRLIYINDITVTLDESLVIEKLNVEVDRVRIAVVPLPLTVLHVVESMGILNPQESFTRSSNVGYNLQKQKMLVQNSASDSILIESITVNTVELNFVSALLATGEFSKPQELRLIASKIQLNQNSPILVHGNVGDLNVLDGVDTKVGWFTGDSDKSDIRLEKKLDSNGAFTLLLYNDFTLQLEKQHLQRIIDFTALFPQIFESLDKLNTNKPRRPKAPEVSNTIQTSNILLKIRLPEDLDICLKITPISFESNSGSLSISKISVFKVQNEKQSTLLTISGSKYQLYKTEKQIRSFDNKGHDMVFTTLSSLSISSIQVEHEYDELLRLNDSLKVLIEYLNFPEPKTVFKTRKRARVTSSISFGSKTSIKLNACVDKIGFKASSINEKFGDLIGSFEKLNLLAFKDNTLQFHLFKGNIRRDKDRDTLESLFRIINTDDGGSPIVSIRTNGFKVISIFLRNIIVDYYTQWISIFEDSKLDNSENNSLSELQSESTERLSNDTELKRKLHFTLVDVGIGLNPGRLKAKAVFVVSNGNLEVFLDHQTTVKAELRSPSLHLIDDSSKLLSHSDAKRHRNYNKSWSQAAYFNSQGFVPIAKSKGISVQVDIKPFVDNQGLSTKSTKMEITSENLDFEMCADSFQCFISLVNDLKNPIVIRPESKYKVNGKEVDVFGDIDEDAFNENTLQNSNFFYHTSNGNDPLLFVEEYYQNKESEQSDDILDKSLGDLKLGEKSKFSNNPHYVVDEALEAGNEESTSSFEDNSDSTFLFEEDHFEKKLVSSKSITPVTQYPMTLELKVTKATVKIFDGYDWKYTRSTIRSAVKNLERRVTEQQKLRTELLKRGLPDQQEDEETNTIEESRIFGEMLFDSIHVSLPVDTEDPLNLTKKINRNIQNIDDKTIQFGKNSVEKLKLRRTKFQKILIELDEVEVFFKLFAVQEPSVTPHDSSTLDDFDMVNETVIRVSDFEVTDNVPTSTWNKFVTLLKTAEREEGSAMVSLRISTVRPILSSAATELIVDAEVLPLRLHIDQDTLEVLIRFCEFKDTRFQLIDEFEDIIYIQKFTINAIKVKLDYKPKKIDYAGLRSGRTNELMNLFILDEASLILKSVTLYGISGFDRLSQLLNNLWMPDIKQTQLTGVLSGLAPVRSIYNIGSNFKNLVTVPLTEYKKDGRIYRSVSKGVTEFGKNTTNELLKFGIKLANGTQAILENAEYALGGTGSAARIPVDLTQETIDELSEGEYNNGDDDLKISDNEDGRFGLHSQLIGKSSLSTQNPMSRSTFQPELESIADINQTVKFKGRTNHPNRASSYSRANQTTNKPYFDETEDFLNDPTMNEEDESQRTVSLYANQPSNLKEGLLLAYDSIGRNFLVAKDAIINAGYEINEGGSAQSLTVAVAKATPIALLRPLIGATEATSRALYGINNELDPSSRKHTEDKYKQVKKK